jgi:hypothetical protein
VFEVDAVAFKARCTATKSMPALRTASASRSLETIISGRCIFRRLRIKTESRVSMAGGFEKDSAISQNRDSSRPMNNAAPASGYAAEGFPGGAEARLLFDWQGA